MKKVLVCLVVGICVFGMANLALAIPAGVTNLLQNSSFETYTNLGSGLVDWDNWTEGGEWYLDNRFTDGSHSARLGVDTGYLYQTFALTSGDTLYFGANFKLITNEFAGNWDQTQINMQVAGLPDTTIGGDVNGAFGDLTWTFVGGTTYESNWFLVAGEVDISGLNLPANAAININLQNYDSANTRLVVDSAYAGTAAAPVPEPSTFLLLGGGLIGLICYRRKR